MGNVEKIYQTVLRGNADASLRFEELCNLVRALGFNERVRGSHHIFTNDGIEEIINIQPLTRDKAKPYQVKQVRNLILKYTLELP